MNNKMTLPIISLCNIKMPQIGLPNMDGDIYGYEVKVDEANLLLEDGGNLLFEDGGQILLEQEIVKQYKIRKDEQ